MGITDAEQKREKRLKTNEETLRELWDNVKCINIHIIGVPEGEEREKGTEKIFQGIIAENIPHMGKEPPLFRLQIVIFYQFLNCI